MPDDTFKVGDRVKTNPRWHEGSGTIIAIHKNNAWIELDGDYLCGEIIPLSCLEPVEPPAPDWPAEAYIYLPTTGVLHTTRRPVLEATAPCIGPIDLRELAKFGVRTQLDQLNAKIVAKLHDMLGADVDPLEEVSKLVKEREADDPRT